MAGGTGSRLGERTQRTPKPLLPIGGRPILEHIISNLETVGVNKIFVSVHYLAEQIEDYVAARAGTAPVSVLREAEPLGTAGSIGLLPVDQDRPFLVLNGDILTSINMAALLDFHYKHDNDGTIAVAQYKVTVPFGVIQHTDDGRFVSIEEKPTFVHFVAGGIYLLSPQYRALASGTERIDMPQFLDCGVAAGLKAGLFPIHENWTDVGRPEDLSRAESLHVER